MQFCDPHMEELRTALKVRGLWGFQAKSEAETKALMRIINGEMLETDDPALFDTVLASQCIIFQRAVDRGGLYILFGDPEGNPLCPLCEVTANTMEKSADWIAHACDGVMKTAHEFGLFAGETAQ